MRAWLPGILIAVGAAVFLVWGSLAKTESAPKLDPSGANVLASGIVASVTDGDTLRLADNRRIRLAQIDAPELPADECYSEQALNALTKLVPIGADVNLRLERVLGTKDEHGRFLAYVRYGKKNVNLELVEMGAAAPYFFQGRRGQYADALMSAARRAQTARRGLWGACSGTTLNPGRRVDTGR